MGGAQPPTGWRRYIAYGGVSLLLGLTQGLGFNLVNNNLPWIQGSLSAYPNEAAWLSTAYTATNATIGLLAIKFRFQYGLRLFGDIGLGLFIVVAIAHLFTDDLRSAIAVRAAAGVAATALSTMALLYMIAPCPNTGGRWASRWGSAGVSWPRRFRGWCLPTSSRTASGTASTCWRSRSACCAWWP
jgi:hypothetical protein